MQTYSRVSVPGFGVIHSLPMLVILLVSTIFAFQIVTGGSFILNSEFDDSDTFVDDVVSADDIVTNCSISAFRSGIVRPVFCGTQWMLELMIVHGS